MPLLDKDGNEMVAHVPLEQFRVMQHDLMFLTCLMNCGIHEWEHYDKAIEMHKQFKEKMDNDSGTERSSSEHEGKGKTDSKIII